MKNDSFVRYIVDEVLREVSGITFRRMFDGWGLWKDGVFFGLIHDGRLFFKTDEQTRSEYKFRGSKPFVYKTFKGKKSVTLSYWEVPVSVIDDAIEIVPWVTAAYEAAIRVKYNKKKRNTRE